MKWFLHNWITAPPRVDREELLDLGEGDLDEVRRSLEDVARINRWLGGHAALRRFVFPALRERTGKAPIRILDVGSGSAALPIAIADWARQQEIPVSIVALDRNERHLAIAAEQIRSYREIHLLLADARELPLSPGSFDLVLSTLFLHHFKPETLRRILPAMASVSRGKVIANDLIRSRLPALLFEVSAALFARSFITRHDGRVSIFRAYSCPELRSILDSAGLSEARIHRQRLYYRMTVVIDRSPNGDTPP